MFRARNNLRERATAIYREHSAFVWRLLASRGVPDRDREDVQQGIFIAILRALPKYKEQGKLKAWIYTITIYHVKQYYRGEGRRKDRMELFTRTTQACGGEPEGALRRLEAGDLLRHFLNELPRRERDHVLLSWVEGMSGPEIAELFDESLRDFHGRERRIRQKLAAFRQRVEHPRI